MIRLVVRIHIACPKFFISLIAICYHKFVEINTHFIVTKYDYALRNRERTMNEKEVKSIILQAVSKQRKGTLNVWPQQPEAQAKKKLERHRQYPCAFGLCLPCFVLFVALDRRVCDYCSKLLLHECITGRVLFTNSEILSGDMIRL